MKILVTGATGFLGSHLVERILLDDPSAVVTALVRDPSRLRWLKTHERLEIVAGGLADPPALPGGTDLVYHLAGLTKTAQTNDYYTVNRDGTARLLERLDRGGANPRIVIVSSAAAGGPGTPEHPRSEDDPPAPVSPYGKSKLEGEQAALALKDRFHVTVLRPGAVYGPRDEDFLEYFRWVKKGLIPLSGLRPKYLSVCHVRDVVSAAVAAASADIPSGEVFNIAHPAPCSWTEFGMTAARLLGCRAVPVRVPNWAALACAAASHAAGRARRRPTPLNLSKYMDMTAPGWVMDTGKALRRLGFQAAVPLEEGLAETLDWYKNKEWL